MKKITLGLIVSLMFISSVALAETETTTVNTDTRANVTTEGTMMKKSVDNVCIGAAVGVREDALISAWGKFNSSITSTLSARKSALVAAWANTDAKVRRAAVRAAWDTANKSRREATKTYKSDRRAAWAAFKIAARACGGGSEAAKESDSSESVQI